jgi:hypothetical protein
LWKTGKGFFNVASQELFCYIIARQAFGKSILPAGRRKGAVLQRTVLRDTFERF